MPDTSAGLHPRLSLLRHLITHEGGEWTPARVARAYAKAGYDAPKGTTHKADLKTLHRMGVLERCEQSGRQFYVASRRTDDQHRATAKAGAR